MKDIIKSLYNGKIIPWERKVPKNQALLEIIRKIEKEEHYLAQKLSTEDGKRLAALADLYGELKAVEEENTFSYGFTLGMTMMLDVIREAEAI